MTTAGMSMDRQCSSGMMAIATAAKSVMVDDVPIIVAGGVESISLVQNEHANRFHNRDPWIMEMKPETYMPMIDTAEVVAKRYNISREVQDAYALESQKRTAAAQAAGKLDDEIIPVTAKMAVLNRDTNEVTYREVTATKDECNRPDTTLEGLAALKPVRDGGCDYGRQRQSAFRRRRGSAGDGSQAGREAGTPASGLLPWPGRGWLRTR